MQLDTLLTALGAERVRRDSEYEKEYSFSNSGLGLGISYNDRSDKAAKVYVKIKDVSRILDCETLNVDCLVFKIC